MELRINNVRISLLREQSVEQAVCRKLRISTDNLSGLKILHRAVDARKKGEIYINYHVLVNVAPPAGQLRKLLMDKDISQYFPAPPKTPHLGSTPLATAPLVIGAGPAGLMAALELAKYGYKPLLLERGKPVVQRVNDVLRFWQTGEFDPDSNVQFGEGGAGTFSDGKLTTRVNDPIIADILATFVKAGAPENILWEHKPHVGTDRLRAMVAGLGKLIRAYGGSIKYEAHVKDLRVESGKVLGVELASGEYIPAEVVVLACGHSARDTYAMLLAKGVALSPKPFAIGLRVEHPQELIDRAQYGKFAGHPLLGPADYALVCHADNGRTAYSFCMCPGGRVIAASSEAGGVVVNGMSMYNRASGIANSALVVNVDPQDFGATPLAGVEFQRHYERLAFLRAGASYLAPAQNLGSFLKGAEPALASANIGTYQPGVKICCLDAVLPAYVTATLRQGIAAFERRLPGFGYVNAVLTGVETRTSAPLRIERDKRTYVSTSHQGLYPCGEGAGYAGGIMSAALDGHHVAWAVMEQFKAPV